MQDAISKVLIREYKAKDEPQVKECLCVLQDYVNVLESGIVATGKQVYDSYFEYMAKEVSQKRGKIFVAELENKILGFIAFYFTQEAYEQAESLYISDLVVLEEHRGMGLGTKLLTYADGYAKAKGAKFIKISALVKNTGAVNLYRKTG